MEIISYRKYSDIDVYFPEYNWTFYHAQYTTFSKGNIKCPYEPRNFGVGYIGEGEFHVKENNKLTEVYYDWFGMLNRVYNTNEHEDYKDEILYQFCKEVELVVRGELVNLDIFIKINLIENKGFVIVVSFHNYDRDKDGNIPYLFRQK